jgi:hypothetical protein
MKYTGNKIIANKQRDASDANKLNSLLLLFTLFNNNATTLAGIIKPPAPGQNLPI